MAWSGTLCGAEQRGNDDINFRTNIIDPGTYFDNITVPRNLGWFSKIPSVRWFKHFRKPVSAFEIFS